MRAMRTSLPRVTEGLDKNRGLSGSSLVPVGWIELVAYLMAARRSGWEKGDGSVTQEQKQEKKKMLKKKEETDKEKKKEK